MKIQKLVEENGWVFNLLMRGLRNDALGAVVLLGLLALCVKLH